MYFNKFPFFAILKGHLINYPTPSSLTYNWNFGSLAGFCLLMQIITGVFLSMHYIATADLAFSSIEHINSDVNYGWLLKNIHSNGASFFFIVIYAHLASSLYFQSFLNNSTSVWSWYSGVVLLILTMAIAFMGYVLPWGQMSLWGATVMTNLFSAIPVIGKYIVFWLWGGYGVDTPTLMSFYTLHYLLPFVLLGMVLIHMSFVHLSGSSFPLKSVEFDYIKFSPYFYMKDLFGILVLLLGLCFFVFFYPNLLNHPDNYIPGNPLVTPPHMVPEWYFLPFYAILRAIPNKLGGVLLMFLSMFSLFFIKLFANILKPTKTDAFVDLVKPVSSRFQPLYQVWFWSFIFNFMLLGWLGAQPAEEPYMTVSLYATCFYFLSLTIVYSFVHYLEYFFLKNFLKNKLFM